MLRATKALGLESQSGVRGSSAGGRGQTWRMQHMTRGVCPRLLRDDLRGEPLGRLFYLHAISLSPSSLAKSVHLLLFLMHKAQQQQCLRAMLCTTR